MEGEYSLEHPHPRRTWAHELGPTPLGNEGVVVERLGEQAVVGHSQPAGTALGTVWDRGQATGGVNRLGRQIDAEVGGLGHPSIVLKSFGFPPHGGTTPRPVHSAVGQVKGSPRAMGVFDQMTSEGHEEVLFGSDRVSGLHSIIAIHSTVLGPALGGTRFFPYPDEQSALRDVLRLSRGMTLKAAAAGLDLGGGKAVIIGNPYTDITERLLRSYGRVVDSLGGRFITAEDVGTSGADIELIRRETPWALGVPVEDGGSGDPSPSTAHGLLAALRAVADHLWKDDHLHGRRVAVQGVGKVGGAFVELLVEAGCEVVVGDVNDEAVARAVETYGVKAVEPDEILSVPCDVFSPCAMGGVLDADSIPRLRCEAVVGSANNQLADDDDDMRLAGLGVLYAPDFVVNSGGLINVAEELGGYRPERAARRVQGVGDATRAILQRAEMTGTTPHRAATEVAEERLASVGELGRWRRRE